MSYVLSTVYKGISDGYQVFVKDGKHLIASAMGSTPEKAIERAQACADALNRLEYADEAPKIKGWNTWGTGDEVMP